MTLPLPMHTKVQLLVDQYAGAVAPGRVIAVAVAAAVDMRRHTEAGERDADFVDHWEASVRRRLTTEVAEDLVRAAISW